MDSLFRHLRADEIDCRISQIKTEDGIAKWVSLLLYKDARCDQNILDETFGAFGWQKEYTRDNRNCIVSVWDDKKAQWISKEDTGTESNTEKEKGLASDSFKRACFCWGIGRALYTAPFIMIPSDKCNIQVKGGKAACYDNFVVTDIDYKNGNICYLTIKNNKTGKECFRWGKKGQDTKEKDIAPDNAPNTDAAEEPAPKQQEKPANNQSAKNQTPPAFTPPEQSAKNVSVSTSRTLPGATPPPNAVLNYLAKERKNLKEARGISEADNTGLWSQQVAILKQAGLTPAKALSLYTMQEAEALVRMMYERFAPTGTELKPDDRETA